MHKAAGIGLIAALIVGGSLLSVSSLAQQSAAPSPTQSGERPAFHGGGISAAISGITVTGGGYRNIRIQMALKNDSPNNLYIAAIKGSTATGSSSNGVGFVLMDTFGLASCDNSAQLEQQISTCAKTFPTDNYIEVDAGQPLIAMLDFSTKTAEEPKGTISFTLRLLVRPAPGNQDTLGSSAAENPSGPARVVTINFPLVPLEGS